MIYSIREYPKLSLKQLIEHHMVPSAYKKHIRPQTKFYCDFEMGLGYNLKLGLQIEIRQVVPYIKEDSNENQNLHNL